MKRLTAAFVATLLVLPVLADSPATSPAIKPGSAFLSPELKTLQADEAANPGMLWVENGARLWSERIGSANRSCADCHGDAAASMKGVATTYPKVDAASGKLLNLEMRINACRTSQQRAEPLDYESEPLLALTVFVARQSLNMPMAVQVDGAAAPFYSKGKEFFHRRQGQLNLSCAQCHDGAAGARLRADVISNGAVTGYPAYRLEWQTLGSLHRRLRACSLGVRATQFDYGSEEYLSLELYLAKRSGGLPIETPGIRK